MGGFRRPRARRNDPFHKPPSVQARDRTGRHRIFVRATPTRRRPAPQSARAGISSRARVSDPVASIAWPAGRWRPPRPPRTPARTRRSRPGSRARVDRLDTGLGDEARIGLRSGSTRPPAPLRAGSGSRKPATERALGVTRANTANEPGGHTPRRSDQALGPQVARAISSGPGLSAHRQQLQTEELALEEVVTGRSDHHSEGHANGRQQHEPGNRSARVDAPVV